MADKIDSPTARGKLTPRREPYWHRLGRGKAIGYRAIEKPNPKTGVTARGSSVVRFTHENGKKTYRALEDPLDLPPADQFEGACRLGAEYFQQCESGPAGVVTVNDALDGYLTDLRIRKGEGAAQHATWRAGKHIRPQLGHRTLNGTGRKRLTRESVKAWRDSLLELDKGEEAEKRSRNGVNRVSGVLKAACNYAAVLHGIQDRAAWQDLKPFAKADNPRQIYFTRKQIDALREAAPPPLRLLIDAMIYTGCRPGELSGAKVSDLDLSAGVLQVDGKTGQRLVYLSDASIPFFKAQCRGKLPGAYLFTQRNGNPWIRQTMAAHFRRAARKAKLPAESVLYNLRHWHISEALKAGADIELLARNVGNSAQIIRQHYHKFVQDDMRKQINKLNVGII